MATVALLLMVGWQSGISSPGDGNDAMGKVAQGIAAAPTGPGGAGDGKTSPECEKVADKPAHPRHCPDPLRHMQWNLDVIEADAALSYATGKGVVVAVIDTGLDRDHPEFAGRILWFSDANLRDPDADGPTDEFGHGTWSAGIIAAAARNGQGIHGIAPDATILPIRPLDGSVEELLLDQEPVRRIAAAVRFATAHGADVISMSLSAGPQRELQGLDELREATKEAWNQGIVLVAAAGNDEGRPYCNEPASHAQVICVSGVMRSGQKGLRFQHDVIGMSHIMAPADNFAPEVLLQDGATLPVEPGATTSGCEEAIVTTDPIFFNGTTECGGMPAGYFFATGTSIATPHVAGVAALLVELGLSNEEIMDRILCTADDLGEPGRDATYGYGRVNALRAVTNDRNEDCGSDGIVSASTAALDFVVRTAGHGNPIR
ncbi:MAG TPA: S8 family serine peptidase [Candidatus Thermoplasmatota archaeon]